MGIESSLTTSFNADETNLLTKIRTSFYFFVLLLLSLFLLVCRICMMINFVAKPFFFLFFFNIISD